MAYGQLVERYQNRVYGVALAMLKNPEDAMDVTQESFVKVYRYIDSFQGSSSFYTWLYRLVVNLCIDHLRKAGKHQDDEYDDRIHAREDAAQGKLMGTQLGFDPASNYDRKELLIHIRKALDTLPPYHKAVIIMREFEGMSYEEIARALDISKGTVMSRLHHARHKMQRALAAYIEGESGDNEIH